MICPKCKTEVSPDDTVCPHCKLRLMFKCPRCDSPARLGSVSCSKCGYTFVKFCPKCHSANYASSSVCRKCGMEFENEKIEPSQNPDSLISRLKAQPKPIMMQTLTNANETKKARKLNIPNDDVQDSMEQETQIQELQQAQAEISEAQNQISKEDPLNSQDTKEELLFFIDFINLERTFEKFNKEEFTQKVIQNIKTTVKITFGTTCEFISPSVVTFTYSYGKKTKIQDKTAQFEQEFEKFNKILEKTLDCGLSYKFAITTLDDIKKGAELTQLKYGSDKDVIVSASAYPKLSAGLSLIKISADSYKMIFLDQKPVFEQSEYVKYDKALETIFNNLADNNAPVRAISVNAPRGAGKTHLLNNLYYRANKAKTNNTVLFYAQCSALTQISAYGLIQSFFVSLFDCPNVLNSEFNLKAFERVVLDKFELEKIDKETLSTLANLIYPMDKSYYENILISKEITHRYLKDIFNYIKNKKNVIFIIDDFDLIDESSYSFLKYLVDEDYFSRDAKLILGYKNPHSIAMYFQTTKLNNNNCLNISLKTLNMAESKTFIKKIVGEDADIPPEIMSQIAYNAQGNIAYIEQILQYMFERKILNVHDKVVTYKKDIDIEIPSTLENCFEERLEFLKEQNEDEYIFLNTASLLGDKPDYRVLSRIFELSENDYFDIVQRLEKKGYLKRKFDDVYGFKNSLTWSYCYIKAKEEELIKDKAHKMLVELNGKVISTPLICPILAQIIGNKELAFSLWTKNLQYASFIGDINIYAMAQKQSLILLESVKTDKLDYIKNNICERLGKLIYTKNPQEARNYLANAIVSAQKTEEINKIIDLSGFLVKSAYLTQDFTGVVEVIDNVLKYFDSEDKTEKRSSIELQVALIKAKKLQALLELGSWEEISNIVNTEINPILQRHLHSFSNHKWIDKDDIFYIWIEANIILVKSYCIQGSPMAFELISEINKVLSTKKGPFVEQLRVSLSYAEAMANTSKGNFSESDAILKDIVKDYSYAIDNPAFVCEWNLISIINKILRMDYTSIKEELFEATAYANNCNNEVSKNLLKTLLAYVMLNEKSYLKAIEISTKQMQYFSSKKIAFGALLSWYISAAATSYNKADMYCIEICEKAVKICENAQNNNFWFKILFQELLAKTYLKLNDKENATMYCDLALQSANANDLAYLQVRLNNLKANIAREKLGEQQEDKKREYAKNVVRIYTRTLDLAKFLNLPNHVKKIEKEITSFRAHCQLNRIIEDK